MRKPANLQKQTDLIGNFARPPPADVDPLVIPDHRLIRCIGRGSYGEVWLAKNLMGSFRAVKIVYRSSFEHDRPFEREIAGIQKFEPLSRSHPGFIDVLQVGGNPEKGFFYYVMELGDDLNTGQKIVPESYISKTLAKEVAARGALPLEECIQLGLSLTEALGQLHANGLIHRDIKPSNIIFVDQIAKLADIGLVTDIKEARSYVGTEGFIPPEGPGTPQADIYSLGKVLYEISTGKDRNRFPELPAELEAIADRDRFLELNEVILRACHKDVGRRYQFATDLHSDFLALLHGKSIKRLRVLEGRIASLKKAVLVASLLLVSSGVLYLVVEGNRKKMAELHQRQVGSYVAYGTRAMEEGDLLLSLPSFVEALRLDARRPSLEKTHRLRVRAILNRCPKLTGISFSSAPIKSVEFSPDERLIAIGNEVGQIQIRDSLSSRLINSFDVPGRDLERLAFSPDSRMLAIACGNGQARVFDHSQENEVQVFNHRQRVYSASFSPDGGQLVTASADGIARVWSLADGKLAHTLAGHKDEVLYAAYSQDGQWIVTTSKDQTARLWDANNGRLAGPRFEHKSWIFHASFSPNSRGLITASFDRKVRLRDVATGNELIPPLSHGDSVATAEFSPDGRHIVTACWDGLVRIWDSVTGQPISLSPTLPHGARVLHASFSPDGRRLATGCLDGTSRIWDLAGSMVPVQPAHLFSSNRVVLKDKPSSANLAVPRSELIANAIWNPKSDHFLTISGSLVQVWHSFSGNCCFPALEHPARVSYAAFSPDGQWLVTCCTDDRLNAHSARVWNAFTGEPVGGPLKHRDGVLYASFSPDSQRVVTASEDFTAIVWETVTGRQLIPPLKHDDQVHQANFSDDGCWIVTASSDQTARVWDAETGEPLTAPFRHPSSPRQAKFIRQSRAILTVDMNGEAWVWDLSQDERPIRDLMLITQLLNGQPSPSASEPIRSIPEIWRELRSKYPQDFAASRDEILAWHWREAELSEDNGQWSAALFHYAQLSRLNPTDGRLDERRANAEQELAAQRGLQQNAD